METGDLFFCQAKSFCNDAISLQLQPFQGLPQLQALPAVGDRHLDHQQNWSGPDVVNAVASRRTSGALTITPSTDSNGKFMS